MSDFITINKNNCRCIFCKCEFNGRIACNGNMNAKYVICPNCKRKMKVYLKIEYTCVEVEND